MKSSLSLCLINKDDEKNLIRLIKEAKQWITEIIVVDTGSKDNSIKSAKLAGANIVVDASDLLDENGTLSSFSKARERSFSLASSRWLLWLDTDDTLDKWELLPKLVEFAEENRFKQGPGFNVRLPYDYSWTLDRKICVQSFHRERLIFKNDGWVWKRPIHEYLECENSKEYNCNDIRVIHLSQGSRGQSNDRNLKILLNWKSSGGLQEEPNTIYYYLGDEMLARRRFNEAFDYFTLVDENHYWAPQAYYRASVCMLNLYGLSNTTVKFILKMISKFPNSHFYDLLAFVQLERKNFSKAYKLYTKARNYLPVRAESQLLKLQLEKRLGLNKNVLSTQGMK